MLKEDVSDTISKDEICIGTIILYNKQLYNFSGITQTFLAHTLAMGRCQGNLALFHRCLTLQQANPGMHVLMSTETRE